jgi:hypothetical protein
VRSAAALRNFSAGHQAAISASRMKLKQKGDHNMTDSNKAQSAKSKFPSHIAYHVRDRAEGGEAFWTRIGSAWAHADGNGFNLQIETVPLNGRITLRVPSEPKQ